MKLLHLFLPVLAFCTLSVAQSNNTLTSLDGVPVCAVSLFFGCLTAYVKRLMTDNNPPSACLTASMRLHRLGQVVLRKCTPGSHERMHMQQPRYGGRDNQMRRRKLYSQGVTSRTPLLEVIMRRETARRAPHLLFYRHILRRYVERPCCRPAHLQGCDIWVARAWAR